MARSVHRFFDALAHDRVSEADAAVSPDVFAGLWLSALRGNRRVMPPGWWQGTALRFKVPAYLRFRAARRDTVVVRAIKVLSVGGARRQLSFQLVGRRSARDIDCGRWHWFEAVGTWVCRERSLLILVGTTRIDPPADFDRFVCVRASARVRGIRLCHV